MSNVIKFSSSFIFYFVNVYFRDFARVLCPINQTYSLYFYPNHFSCYRVIETKNLQKKAFTFIRLVYIIHVLIYRNIYNFTYYSWLFCVVVSRAIRRQTLNEHISQEKSRCQFKQFLKYNLVGRYPI